MRTAKRLPWAEPPRTRIFPDARRAPPIDRHDLRRQLREQRQRDEQGALPLADSFTSERVHPAFDQLGTIDNIVN